MVFYFLGYFHLDWPIQLSNGIGFENVLGFPNPAQIWTNPGSPAPSITIGSNFVIGVFYNLLKHFADALRFRPRRGSSRWLLIYRQVTRYCTQLPFGSAVIFGHLHCAVFSEARVRFPPRDSSLAFEAVRPNGKWRQSTENKARKMVNYKQLS